MAIAELVVQPIEARRRHPLIGAEVRGLDLSRPLDEATRARVHDLWMEHLVLVFPGQSISDEQHIAFGKNFGELEIHVSVAHRSSRNAEIYRVSTTTKLATSFRPRRRPGSTSTFPGSGTRTVRFGRCPARARSCTGWR